MLFFSRTHIPSSLFLLRNQFATQNYINFYSSSCYCIFSFTFTLTCLNSVTYTTMASQPSSVARPRTRTLHAMIPLDILSVVCVSLFLLCQSIVFSFLPVPSLQSENKSSTTYAMHECAPSIVCSGVDGTNELEYQVKAYTYANPATVPKPDQGISVAGRLLTSNNALEEEEYNTSATIYFDMEEALHVNTSQNLPASLADKTSMRGLGLIIDHFAIDEPGFDKPTIVSVIEHCNYDTVVSLFR